MVSASAPQSDEPCHLVAIGASTGVGGTAAVSMAAVRAGLTRTERVSYGPAEEDWSHAVRVSTLAPVDAEARAEALLGSALAQVAPTLAPAGALRVGAWVAGPARAAPLVARHLRLGEGQVAGGAEHGAGGLLALGAAWAALRERRVDVAVVAAVGVLSDAVSLARARREARVLGGTSSFGTVPGEAAAALVWASEDARERLGAPSLGRLLAVAQSEETTPFGGPVPCVGEGLVRAVRDVVAASSGARVARVLCNLNGERERTDEWGFALPRLSEALAAPGAFVTAIGAFGDVEAPAGLLLLGLACALSGRQGSPSSPSLIWTSSREPARAAALFEPAAAPLRAAGPAPAWARALDDSVLLELADEAGFRYGQRLFQCSGQAGTEPQSLRLALTRIEGALDAAVHGLADCGPHGWERAEAPLSLEQPSPGALYTAARVAFEARQPERAESLIVEHLAPATTLAARLAIEHAPPLGEAVAPLVEEWLRAGPRLAALALRLAAHNGLTPSSGALRAASEALSEAAAAEAAEWLAALSRLGHPGALPLIERWRSSRHERLRRGWANAALCVGKVEGRAAVLARLEQDPAVILPAALCVDAARAGPLRELASALSGPDACLALGILGDARAVPHLLQCLAEPSRAEAAALALELLLGVAPEAPPVDAEDRAEGSPPRPASSLDPGAWDALARPALARHSPEARLRSGAVCTSHVTLALLERVHLPMRLRGYLARELSVRWGLSPTVDVEGLLRSQGAALRALSSSLPGETESWK